MTFAEPEPTLVRRQLNGRDARVAVMRRTYAAPVADVWDACTKAERLSRWYTTVTGDLRVGGSFEQANMGSGVVEVCEPPHHLVVSLGGGVDEIELRLAPSPDGGTDLEIAHATTLDAHEIGGQMYDAIFCMGGGYYPRLVALDKHLRGTLPDDYDASAYHLRADTRADIERGSAAMAALLERSG